MGLPEETAVPTLFNNVEKAEIPSRASSDQTRNEGEKETAQIESEKSSTGGNVEYTSEAERLQALRESKYLTGSELLFFSLSHDGSLTVRAG